MQSRLYSVLAAFAVLFIGVFVGTRFGIYDMFPTFDKVMHFSGGFAAAWIIVAFFREDLRKLSPLKAVVTVISLAALIGVLWEFVEYKADVYLPIYAPRFQHYLFIGDLPDTLADLAFDMGGAGLLLLLFRAYRRAN